ncbi:uncharacterized protein TM35_000212810 [Trypanosoma theileri]|uniref:Uncharacterized protein n=1 Tax=Trypanosoma theileri TaxID=67003 RepID=A0A1X0NSI6_9TRYP|nr:uncharacterized protein TM35_000212810 [Trypanosoma theileri]ORC87675.1 hypothetical protein TM35_000212810 [Trypanosoma theileri]
MLVGKAACPLDSTTTPGQQQNVRHENSMIVDGHKKESSNMRLREKYETVKSMRSNEVQEALLRECELSSIIMELKKRITELEASREHEREIHKRESFYVIKENECLKQQVHMSEKMLEEARTKYDKEMKVMQARFSVMEDRLLKEKQRAKEREAEYERVTQDLCHSLFLAQKELELYAEQNKELAAVKQSLEDTKINLSIAKNECSLWQDVLRRREMFLLLERETFVGLQCDWSPMFNRRCFHHIEEKQRQLVKSGAEQLVDRMNFELSMYDEIKSLLLSNAKVSMENRSLSAKHCAKSQELSRLSEQYEAVSLMFSQYMRDVEKTQSDRIESKTWLKALDDATIGYVLHQRDCEVADKLRKWKDGLLEAHKLLRALLKRYEPFQKGDEVFVSRVIECLSSAPHVKEPVNVWLP